MTALQNLLNTYRQASASEREKGTYFEELISTYLRNEASYRDLYSDVWTYAQWAETQKLDKRDAGIDLVARTHGTGEYHAIQCKFFADDYRVQKADIDSFFTASGKKQFSHRVIIATTNNWSNHAEDALLNQHPPVTKIDLQDLENSQIDWGSYQPKHEPILREKKKLREHQILAVNAVEAGLRDADRGKLIMACGTGKTFTSLKIAEKMAGAGKRVLFLVPSLSLLSQTLTEWTQESQTPLHSFAVCSDSDVGKKRQADDDIVQTFTHELRYPATTQPKRLAEEMSKRHDSHHMSVVFSTYHSIETISKAQLEFDLSDFDLIVCDEAHRTTGATFDDEEESNFVKVHDAQFLRSAKRLYMTATPRIYGDNAKASAEKESVALCSMDDEALYGKQLYLISFSEAVRRGLLVDYKVLVLAVDEDHVNARLQKLLAGDDNQIKVDDAAKIVGCWKALSKQGTREDLSDDAEPMRRAVAFCQVIEYQAGAKSHKVSSKNIANMFQAVVEAYQEKDENDHIELICEAEHVDGGMNASAKEAKLSWLKAAAPEGICRILSNVRCLSEGVDVPALDAVLFLTPRNSQVDVVQSVGRVMRNSQGKKRGYVVLPVVIPSGVEPHEALNDNKTYKVVWQVLQALRSHDDRFDAMVNKLDLIGKDISKMEVIAVSDKISKKSGKPTDKKNKDSGKGTFGLGEAFVKPTKPVQAKLEFEIGEIERAIYAKVVQKCGNRSHWEDWANDIAKIAKTHISRIKAIVETAANIAEIAAFCAFADELRDDLNGQVTDDEVIEMLAQHLITKPVFDALFEGYSFAQNNPMSLAMQAVLDTLQKHNISKEADTLQGFYDSVKLRAAGISNAAAKQKIIVELYDKFFKNAFPRMTDKLGIVYTPVEVVDFIIHSVNDALKNEFGLDLGSKGVHIIDPFTGTGTFITRLLQSGLISKEQLTYKYKNEIHANEIVLLAYYIAAINIESVYHAIAGGEYAPFDGICLTDTFQLYEKDDLVNALLVDNSARRTKQKKLDIRVIVGNPPYSSGQKNENDNNKNVDYPMLDGRIEETYIKSSARSMGKSKSYDSYIRAIRWASDRLGVSGVMGFVSNASFLDSNSSDGLRKCLAEEFSSIYVFHLRGNQRTSGEKSRQEGGKIFDAGSRAPIAITIFIKNPNAAERGRIVMHDIGDYLSRDEKLAKIKELRSIGGISGNNGWVPVLPDKHNDWVGQREDGFNVFMSFGDKANKHGNYIFSSYSMGIKTNRDEWVYQSSKAELTIQLARMLDFYNSEVRRIADATYTDIGDVLNRDKTKIKWTTDVQADLEKGKIYSVCNEDIVIGLYRPFTKMWVYANANWNWTRHLMPKYFPDSSVKNLVICVTGVGAGKGFTALMTDVLPNLHTVDTGQCFPHKIYEDALKKSVQTAGAVQSSIFEDSGKHETPDATAECKYKITDGISDAGLAYFQAAYPGEEICKDDIFYYTYGLLHSEDYKNRYADNLSKELPRAPCVRKCADFWDFSKAGRALADLHVNYETVQPYPVEFDGGGSLIKGFGSKDFAVTQMRFGKKGKEKDRTTVIYNQKITIINIPVVAYDYIVNGKPALEWVMERQAVTTYKDSGIINDANRWASETIGDARHPLELFQRVITVSLETMKIVRGLPKLDIP
ncbi:FIG003033: Helicase domain protein [Janthinobacterium sp. CG23_2]|nr:FIG003033: Helicase domain protein [Janthinobacterium sp. CG23_2]CUU31462.1 FIG003033: Helicase domain protein [Janthinobacterium sp. CG23_2]